MNKARTVKAKGAATMMVSTKPGQFIAKCPLCGYAEIETGDIDTASLIEKHFIKHAFFHLKWQEAQGTFKQSDKGGEDGIP